jgi:DNA-binding response OmpR family regulator
MAAAYTSKVPKAKAVASPSSYHSIEKTHLMTKRLLLAEDDQDFRNLLAQFLGMFDYEVTTAVDGAAALEAFQLGRFDICVLDVMMPKLNGFDLAEKIIAIDPEMPFIFLTARKLKEDKIRGLKLGADDYIAKPFEADELVLRLNNILRRRNRVPTSATVATTTVAIGAYTFSLARLELVHGSQIQRLTQKETDLINYLFQQRNTLIRREALLQAVWKSDDFFSGRSMDVFISRLRKYFKKDPNISIISTRGVGLEFRVG